MDGIRWISMTMSERILIMVKNKVVLKERDAWSDLANFIGEMVAKYAESMELDNLPDPDFYLHRERIGKPVRDKIPQIIVSDGKSPIVRIFD